MTGLPYAGTTDATPRVSDWTLAAFSVTGLASYSTTLTWTNGMVLDVVSIECYECDDGNGYRLEVNLKLDAADTDAGANGATLCGGGGFAAAVDSSGTSVSLFGAAATTNVATACRGRRDRGVHAEGRHLLQFCSSSCCYQLRGSSSPVRAS